MDQEEDEWCEIMKRFKVEGIDFDNLRYEERIVHIYRWLVDAEINLKNSRHICEKLRNQQNEELEEMENYMGKVRDLTEKRKIDIENESAKLNEQLEDISSSIGKLKLQGNTLVEKISNLVTEYIRLSKEVQILNKLKLSHSHSDDLISEMILITTEKEALKREVMEMGERMQFLQKNARELELDNEKLTFKLSEAFAELEEKEIRLGEYTTFYSGDSNNLLPLSNTRPRDSNISTLSRKDVDQCSANFDKKDISQEYSLESTSSSLLPNDAIDYKSTNTSRLSSLMSSCHEMARLEENKRLQSECESLKTKVTTLGERYNNLALKYLQIKAKKKFQTEELRGRFDASLCQIETLQVQVSVQRQRLRAEEIFRKQIESDLRKLQDEKRSIIVRLQNSDMEQKESHREISILQKKIAMLDSANSDLLSQLLKLKYKEPHYPKKNDEPSKNSS